jgi:predicted NBD/HSP70 family sugar kinase
MSIEGNFPTHISLSDAIRSSISKHIMEYGSFTIPQIANDSGISITTIAKYVNNALSSGLIKQMDVTDSNKKGRRANVYGVNSDIHLFLGVEINYFELNIALMDYIGNIKMKASDSEFIFENTYDTLDSICTSVENFIKKASDSGVDTSKIRGITFNISGRVNTVKGTSASLFNFEETKEMTLAQLLKNRFGKEIYLMNDTKAMTYAEYLNLNGRYKNMLYINASWGLGLGIIINGELYYGKDGYSGEFGHNPGYNNNILCHCGKKGCIETEVSGNAISRKIIERIKKGESSALSEVVEKKNYLTPTDIIWAIEKEDSLTIDIVSQAGNELGRHIAGLLNIFNPEIIVIGGSLSLIPSVYFLKQIEVTIYKYSLRLMSQNVPIVYSTFGHDAGITGACLIARRRCLAL